ncbi:hypothetical protein C8R47DRAFT_1181216 [Mycena vitilis]|nr:hypothetical protein C8R47DRAFT_1181216 [Mycena vitilis]
MTTRRDRRRKETAAPAASARSHVSIFTLPNPTAAADEPITTYVDRVSHDHRRLFREELPLDPPSPAKRLKISESARSAQANASLPAPELVDPFTFEVYRIPGVNDDNGGDPFFAAPKPVRKVTPSCWKDISLSNWIPKRDIFLSELMRLEGWGDADGNRCPECLAPNPEVRCRDCHGGHGGALFCDECMVALHLHNPLHRVYRWTSLSALGLRVQLGHRLYERCPAPEPANKNFVALHTNGIHEIAVDFCGCEKAAAAGLPAVQLLRAGWYPATHEKPQTCATLAVLEKFHQDTLQAKTTMYDFYGVLERLTNNAGIKPPDRYHEFIRMCRQYRHLMLLKRGGRALAYDASGVYGTKPGELALECPACPRPGVNMEDGWEDLPESMHHKITLFLAMDACFRLKRRLVSSELKDPAIGSGWAYMLEDTEYRKYLLTVTKQKEMKTCSGLAALDFANTKFSRGYGATGVGMGVCARHEFVQPNGCGDLQRGERFANMDYIYASILRHKHPRLPKMTSYDIACIWSKFLEDRLKKLPPLVRINIILTLMRFVIPKMHIHAHTLLCQIYYSLNLMFGSGETDGEGIERPWASVGGIASSILEMGPGARLGVLDCQWSFWNWTKLIGLVATLRRRMDRAKAELTRQRESFDAFSVEQAEHVPGWKTKVDDFEREQRKLGGAAGTTVPNNPYEVKVKGMTEAQVRLHFSKEEEADAARGVPSLHDVTPSSFISTGLEIENEQRRVRVQAELKKAGTAGMEVDLTAMRTSLNHRIARYRKLQATYTPAALVTLGQMKIPEEQTVENMPLLLPSALTPAQRATCKAGLADIEEMMRDAQCRESLSRFLLYKEIHARHQGANTRSRSIIRLHSEKYQTAWEAIRRLLPDNDPAKVGWHQLSADDIRCMEDVEDLEKKAERAKRQKEGRKRKRDELRDAGEQVASSDEDESEGEGDKTGAEKGRRRRGHEKRPGTENRRVLSWIWTVAGIGGTDAELEDALRIEWSKAYARVRRWTEEGEIVEAEYDRVLRSFDSDAALWDARAAQASSAALSPEEKQGAIAFARKQAWMYRDLKARGIITWTEEKLGRGKKRARFVPSFPTSELVDREGDRMEEEEEERRRREEEEEDRELLGGTASDEEFIMGGEGEDD